MKKFIQAKINEVHVAEAVSGSNGESNILVFGEEPPLPASPPPDTSITNITNDIQSIPTMPQNRNNDENSLRNSNDHNRSKSNYKKNDKKFHKSSQKRCDTLTNGYHDNAIQNASYMNGYENATYNAYALQQAGPSNGYYTNTNYQEPSMSNGHVYNQAYNQAYTNNYVQTYYNGYNLVPPPPPPPELSETNIDTPPHSNESSNNSSLNLGLEDILKNIPSTSNGTLNIIDIVNLLSQRAATLNSLNQKKAAENSATLNKSQRRDSCSNDIFPKICRGCDFTDFRLLYRREKVLEMRSITDELSKNMALLDEKCDKINNALSAFGNIRFQPTSSPEAQFSGAIAPQELIKKKVAEYLNYVISSNGQSYFGDTS